jgi:hypothetical protein
MAINPLQQPINYSAQMVDLGPAFAGFGQAFQTLGQGFAAEAKREEAAAAKAQYAADLQAAISNPTQNSWNELIVKYPQQREAFESVRKNYGEEKVKNEFNQGAEISMALENNSPEVAKALVTTVIEAKKNSGEPVGAYQRIFDALETGDIKTAQANVNGYLAFADPDRFEKMVKAKTTATTAPDIITKASAEAVIKAAEAKFAPQKFGLEIDLTQSQIDQAKAARLASDAAAKASGAQAQRLQAEANQIAAGIIPAEKRPEAESKFRKEYSDQTKGYQEVKSAYGRVLASQETAAGDLALIFNYMKMLDPGSVVRESEFATAQNAAGVPDRIKNLYNNLNRGERLNPEQRKMFGKQAEALFNQAGEQEKTVRSGIERIAKGYGLNTENIFFTPTEVAPTAPGAAPPAAPGAPVSVTTPTGQVLTFPNQQAADAFKRAARIP